MFQAVVIASVNRPAVLAETVAGLRRQTCPPDQIVASVTCPADAEGVSGVTVVVSARGSAVQRNVGVDAVDGRCDVVSFLDDDVELADDYCRRVRAVLAADPGLAGVGGVVVADGARTGGLTRDAARAALAAAGPPPAARVEPWSGLYGCNMNVRRSALDVVRFDEKFAAYGWLEDADFSHRLLAVGRLGQAVDCRLVHLAVSAGRVSGRRMGISQVVNPMYLCRKGGHGSAWQVVRRHWVPGVLANVAGLLGRGPRHVDRLGRLVGNGIGLWHVARGRVDPEVVLRHR